MDETDERLPPLVKTDRVAYLASVHPETVRRWIHEGRLPAVRIGREFRVRRDVVEALLAGTLAHKLREFAGLKFQVHRAALYPRQVRQYGLPYAFLKETEKRAEAWEAATGVQQTENDALAALQPDRLRAITEAAIAPFYDATLDDRVRQAEQQWIAQARQAIAEQADADLQQSVEAELGEISTRIQQLLASVQNDADGVELPPMPERPTAAINEADQPTPLCDSRWTLAEQTQRLLASRSYELEEDR